MKNFLYAIGSIFILATAFVLADQVSGALERRRVKRLADAAATTTY